MYMFFLQVSFPLVWSLDASLIGGLTNGIVKIFFTQSHHTFILYKMADEDSFGPTKPASDQKRSTMVRASHRGQSTKLKTKVDAFILGTIDSQTKRFEGKDLLGALQDQVNMIQ